MGLTKKFKEIEQKAKHLPVIFDEQGKKVNHAKRMKDLYKYKGSTEVNNYIKDLFYAHKMAQLTNQNKQL